MKKIKYLLFALFVISSFYFTDRIMLFIEQRNPLMIEIMNNSDDYKVQPVNATINNNTIIPGIKGQVVNHHKSFIKMEEFGAFNEAYLVYDMVDPQISLKNHKDKIIIKGNSSKRGVSLIVEENEEIEKYLNDNNIKYDYLAKIDSNLNIEREYINTEVDKNFDDLKSLFNKRNINNKICLVNYSNINVCKENNYYLVMNSLSTDNYLELIKEINNGDIILIKKNIDEEKLKIILNEIKRLDLRIMYLSELISE